MRLVDTMSDQVLSFERIFEVENGWLWQCVSCQTVVMSHREDLRNCRICALIAQMQMAMPRG